MCLILFAYKTHPSFDLIVAANRDEFYQRPTRRLDFWPEAPQLLAGQDLEAGGTWLGLTRTGRFAAVTNVRQGQAEPSADLRSRGQLPLDFLLGQQTPLDYLAQLQLDAAHYAGFNLLLSDGERLYYGSNRNQQTPRELEPGIYGLSNAALNSPWPKVEQGCIELKQLVNSDNLTSAALFKLLQDSTVPADHELPNTGVGLEWERRLGSRFIESTDYGTRSSLVLLRTPQGGTELFEQSYNPQWQPPQRFQLTSTKP